MQRYQSSANGERRGPLVLENVKADGAGLRADIRVPDLGVKFHLKIGEKEHKFG